MRRASALVALLVCVGCVSIDPIPSASPARSALPPASPTLPTQSGQPTDTAAPPSTPGASDAPEPTGPATPGPTIDPELSEQIDSVIAQVPAIRQLEPLADVPYEFITREQFRDDLIELEFAEVPQETRDAEERLLKRLGLVPDDADLEQLLLDLYGGQVAAFYRPDTKRFYIIQREQPFGPADKIIVAHEYTHALQDQHFDLEGTRVKDLSQGDAALGQLGAIEGDATLTMQLWAIDNLTETEAIQVLFESLGQLDDPVLASIPPVLRRQLEYPYAEGFSFIREIHGLGGFDAVNTTITHPPASTEQVLHPDKYLADEAPVDVSLPDATSALGEGWQVAYEQTMGELLMQVWAAGDETPAETIPGLPVEWPHAETVAGWGGDRLAMYEHSDDRWAIAWRSAWDSTEDATEFAARASDLRSSLDGVSALGGANGQTEVTLVVASDQATLEAFATQFGFGTRL